MPAAKKNAWPFLLLILCCITLTFQSCRKKRTEMANVLFKRTHNIVFKDIDPDEYSAAFKKILESKRSQLTNPDIIFNHYDQDDYPTFVMDHLWNGDIDILVDSLKAVNKHGLDPGYFQPDKIHELAGKLKESKSIKTKEDAYQVMAELEMLTANSLINYSDALQFGIINPKRIFSRYFMKTTRPDSISMNKVFGVSNMRAYLDSIRPKDREYLALQKALADGVVAPKLSKKETRRILLVNLERLRWKNKPAEDSYIMVNIPDFHLDVMEKDSVVLSMKVCVGEGRNKKNQNTLERYDDTCKLDKPYPHETPLLNSVIHSVQVNPIWNIPQSIATKEIIVEAAKDPYYLSNKNIDVYKDGKKIEDSEDIDWSKVTKENNDYDFKQEPGEDNSLGKIKFLFNNHSNVYLHDTPAKEAFHYSMRAVSHGCVRLEKPLDLAKTLFTDTVKYNMIAKDMAEDSPDPTDISLRPKMPVYITYITCWTDKNGQLQFRKDVYGLDIVLYDHLQKFLPVE